MALTYVIYNTKIKKLKKLKKEEKIPQSKTFHLIIKSIICNLQ